MAGRFDVAVVVPTLLRPTLDQAVRSIYAQRLDGRIQVLIGIDTAQEGRDRLDLLLAQAPSNVSVTVFDPGYSTSGRHGGVHRSHDCGALRTILSYMADASAIAYLDDDNWWAEDHLDLLLQALHGHAWAFSLRRFVDQRTDEVLVVDDWESVGPGRGTHRRRFGGFVDTNCLMIDMQRCESVLPQWSLPFAGSARQRAADRNVFAALLGLGDWGESGAATVFYRMSPDDIAHPERRIRIRRRLLRDFDGFRRFAEGDFAAAAAGFRRIAWIEPPGIYGSLWLYVATARAGNLTRARADLRSALAGGSEAARTMLALMTGGAARLGLDPAVVGAGDVTADVARLAFFAGQAALLAGFPERSAVWLAIAARGAETQVEAVAARADLARLHGRELVAV